MGKQTAQAKKIYCAKYQGRHHSHNNSLQCFALKVEHRLRWFFYKSLLIFICIFRSFSTHLASPKQNNTQSALFVRSYFTRILLQLPGIFQCFSMYAIMFYQRISFFLDLQYNTRSANSIYYMDESVLLGTKPLVDSIRHSIRDQSGVFSV